MKIIEHPIELQHDKYYEALSKDGTFLDSLYSPTSIHTRSSIDRNATYRIKSLNEDTVREQIKFYVEFFSQYTIYEITEDEFHVKLIMSELVGSFDLVEDSGVIYAPYMPLIITDRSF